MSSKGGELAGNEDGKKKRQLKKDVKVFDPPDGGWGWMIVVAAGLSNFCILPVLQSFGLIFRDRFADLGITSSETTTIININSAVTACIGLSNGPVFRKYSYRQMSFIGALVCATSITVLSQMKTFTAVLIFFSILYGAGIGIVTSANALALNTYFKKKRRVATGFSWTCTGLGPILMPQIITLLMPVFEMEGTVLIFGGFAFNAVACALLLQPVLWHVKKREDEDETVTDEGNVEESHKSLLSGSQSKSLENVIGNTKLTKENRLSQRFGSQYLYYDDKEDGASGIDVIGPGTPMMSRANDGWYSRKSMLASNASLASNMTMKRENSQKALSRHPSTNLSRYPSLSLSRQPSLKALSKGLSNLTLNRQNSEGDSRKSVPEKAKRKISNLPSTINSQLIIVNESCEHPDDECTNNKCNNEECMKRKLAHILEVEARDTVNEEADIILENEKGDNDTRHPCYKRLIMAVIIFFDLDLLKDHVYVNLMLGITFANFSELNFSLLTPFILGEYGFTKVQVATAMSILAGVDVATRITIPFIATYLGWENRTFFLVGVSGMAIGRIVLAHTHDYYVTLGIVVLIGAGKGLRTIFMALVIPTHVPLERLPAASGLQLVTSGIVFLTVGPIVGWIRDSTGDYTLMLHCLNIFTYLTAISWITERWLTKRRQRRKAVEIYNGDAEKAKTNQFD